MALSRRPSRYDLMLAAVFVTLALAEALVMQEPAAFARLLAMVTLVWRRVAPEVVLAIVVLTVVATDTDGQTVGILAVALATFTLGTERSPRAALASAAAAGALATAATAITTAPPQSSDLAALFVFFLAPALVGIELRRRMLGEARALALAARAEERRQRETDEAVSMERARIARELHDVVSHALTIVTINTQAVRRSLDSAHEREVTALRSIEDTARSASSEMRRLLGVLRSDGDPQPLQPQPGLEQLPSLASGFEDLGLRVCLDISPTLALTAGADVTAYRIVQEALTNVLRHADAKIAWVRVRHEGRGVCIEVEDDGRGGDSETRSGHGLVGIRERAHVYGGSAHAGHTGSGFRVEVILPAERAL